jgi:cellobiose-specific phosphotransferase system component IIC
MMIESNKVCSSFKKMIILLKYYYFRMFSYFSEGSSVPVFRTFCVTLVFVYFNLMAVAILISLGINRKIILPVGKSISWLWPLLIIIPLFYYFTYLLEHRGWHVKILEEFSSETKNQRKRNGSFIILYFICSILFFIGVLWLRQYFKGY